MDSPWHWAIVVVLAIVLFGGYKKLPEASRSLGRSLRIFRTEIKGLTEDEAIRDAAKTVAGAPAEFKAAVGGVELDKPGRVMNSETSTVSSTAPVPPASAAPSGTPSASAAAPTTPGTV